MAIVLGFLRRLLRRVLVPAGSIRVVCLEIAGRGYGLRVAGPWKVPAGKMWEAECIVRVWEEELPEGFRFWLREVRDGAGLGRLDGFMADVGLGARERLMVRSSVASCVGSMNRLAPTGASTGS